MPQEPEWEGTRPPSASKTGFFGIKRASWPRSKPDIQAPSTAQTVPLSEFDKEIDTSSAVPIAETAFLPKYSLHDRLNRYLPPHRRYLGLSRRVFLIIVLVAFICLLALILGLGLGLGLKKNSGEDLPLPSNTATFTGDLTYYGPGLGACGVTSGNDDPICAVSHIIFDAAGKGGSNPNANPLCGRKIRIQRFNEEVNANRSIDVTVVDRCVGCAADDLDLSPGMFVQLAAISLGRVKGSWAWLPS